MCNWWVENKYDRQSLKFLLVRERLAPILVVVGHVALDGRLVLQDLLVAQVGVSLYERSKPKDENRYD